MNKVTSINKERIEFGKELNNARMEYEMLGMTNSAGLSADMQVQLRIRYKESQNKYFGLLAKESEQ